MYFIDKSSNLLNMRLFKKAKRFPSTPGVYEFIGKNNEVLYVGRAINLKRRILNYFQKTLDPRIREMVVLAKNIKFIKTQNHLEAIILEANLIKKYWPKYNVKDRDDRSFVYVVFPKTEFSKPLIIRQKELEKFSPRNAHIFGPYQSSHLIRSALKIIRRIFPYSLCAINSSKTCFDYQIGLCPGACVSKISAKDYQKNINNIILFLSGKKKELLKKLKKENPKQIRALNHIQDVSLLEGLNAGNYAGRIEGYDISHLSGKETVGSMVVFTNAMPDKDQYRIFKIKSAPAGDDLRALTEVLERRLNHREWQYPDLFVIDGGKPQLDFVKKVFQESKIQIPFLGISKFQNDKLVIPKNFSKNLKELVQINKKLLLQVRDEAHRFANSFGRRKRVIHRG